MNFIKSSLLTGLYVLLPLLLLWIGIKEIAGLLVEMVDPIASMFPSDYFDDVHWPGIVAALLVVITSFIVGVIAKLPYTGHAAERFESAVLNKVPMYRMLKLLSSSLVRSDTADVSSAIIKDGSGGGEPCYVLEEHESGLATVLVPWSPASFAGSIKVVPRSQLEYLDCTFDEFSHALSLMGVGMERCMKGTRPPKTAEKE